MRQVADPVSCTDVHGIARYVRSVEHHLAGIRAGKADDDVERRGLTRSIGPQQPDYLSLSNPQANIINDLASLVRFRQLNCRENLHGRSWRDAVLR